jgi:hypothetical protein
VTLERSPHPAAWSVVSAKSKSLIPVQRIERFIVQTRGHKVMLDRDLANLYDVPIKVLNQAVPRNGERFAEDFMFRVTWEEPQSLKSRNVTLNGADTAGSGSQSVTLKRADNIKYRPYAFTEQGVAMLSSVLRSPRAIQVNIEIMQAFVRLRRLLGSHKAILRKIEAMEKKYDVQFRVVFDAIRESMEPSEPNLKKPIGCLTERDG